MCFFSWSINRQGFWGKDKHNAKVELLMLSPTYIKQILDIT
jgi:hypothetical protein